MKKESEFKKNILQESETEILLKSFLNKMNKFMGEECTVLMFTEEYDIVKSLSKYTSRFNGINNKEIEFILIRNAILSNINNYYINVIKEKMAFGEFHDISTIVELIEENLGFRRSLVKALMNQSNVTDEELYNNLSSNENVINELDTLRFFENNRKSVTDEREKLVLRKKSR